MSAHNVTEKTVDLILTHIKSKIATALTEVRTERDDPQVQTPPPRSYFIYEGSWAFQCPAIFVVPVSVDFNLDRGGNFINATVDTVVSVVVEDRLKDLLSKSAWRYQDALHNILDNAQLESATGDVKIVTKVKGADYSETFSVQNDNTIFRKEVALRLDVEHWEKP